MSRATANGGDRLSRLQKLQMEIDNRRMEDSNTPLGSKGQSEIKKDTTSLNGPATKPREKPSSQDLAKDRQNRLTTPSRYVPLSERAGSGISAGYGPQDNLEKKSLLSNSNSSLGSASGSTKEVMGWFLLFHGAFENSVKQKESR